MYRFHFLSCHGTANVQTQKFELDSSLLTLQTAAEKHSQLKVHLLSIVYSLIRKISDLNKHFEFLKFYSGKVLVQLLVFRQNLSFEKCLLLNEKMIKIYFFSICTETQVGNSINGGATISNTTNQKHTRRVLPSY